MASAYVLSEADYLKLKQDHYTLQREMTNLKRTVARGIRPLGEGGRIGPAQVRFRNDNSGTAPKYGVLRITGAQTGKNNTGGFFTIDQPDSTYRWIYIVNGEKDIPAGGFGFGSFLTTESINIDRNQVLYGSGTPAYGDEWGPTPSAWSLTKYSPGFFIFGGNDTTNTTTIAIQRLPFEVLVKNGTGSPYAAGHTGDTYQVFGGAEGSETNSNMTLVCCNRSSTAFDAGKFGAAARLGGGNYAVPFQT